MADHFIAEVDAKTIGREQDVEDHLRHLFFYHGMLQSLLFYGLCPHCAVNDLQVDDHLNLEVIVGTWGSRQDAINN